MGLPFGSIPDGPCLTVLGDHPYFRADWFPGQVDNAFDPDPSFPYAVTIAMELFGAVALTNLDLARSSLQFPICASSAAQADILSRHAASVVNFPRFVISLHPETFV
jgi:hypothetical protein